MDDRQALIQNAINDFKLKNKGSLVDRIESMKINHNFMKYAKHGIKGITLLVPFIVLKKFEFNLLFNLLIFAYVIILFSIAQNYVISFFQKKQLEEETRLFYQFLSERGLSQQEVYEYILENGGLVNLNE